MHWSGLLISTRLCSLWFNNSCFNIRQIPTLFSFWLNQELMKFSEPLKTQNPFIIINSLDSGEKEIRWVQRSFLEFIFWNFHNLAWSESNPTKITKTYGYKWLLIFSKKRCSNWKNTLYQPRSCKRSYTLFQKSLLLFSTWREYLYNQPTHFSSQPKK